MPTDAGDGIPELVPARMVNEFTYCPRLFFLEWVQARFFDNDDTQEGRAVHHAVDQGGGPVPEDPDVPFRPARSVALSSPRLGVNAVLDIVETLDGMVSPIERKRGSAPENAERSWEPERVQLCVQGLLLRDAGYRCEEGYLSFAASRERVRVVFDETLVQRTMELLTALRETAALPTAPAPLVDSPKCPRCSLVGICLPDETNALAGRTALRLRRLMPSDPAGRPVYVHEQGASTGRTGGRLEVRRQKEILQSVRLLDVTQLCVFGNVQVTTPLLRELFVREVPVCYFSGAGWFTGIAHGMPSRHVELRRQQLARAGQGGLILARACVAGKIKNCRTMLRRNAHDGHPVALARLASAVNEAQSAGSIATLLGIEGAAARTYFQEFPQMLRAKSLPGDTFCFDGRNRRPPRDAINCLLSYAYSLLVKDLTVACLAVGFDPYVGFLHAPRFGRPALALDLAEEFRPLVGDSLVLTVVNNGEVQPHDFVVRAGGVALTPGGRRAVLAAYERRMETVVQHPMFGYRMSYRRLLDVQARLLAAHLLGETPEYVSFTTR